MDDETRRAWKLLFETVKKMGDMTKLTDHDAFGHIGYEPAVANAVDRAFRSPGDCFTLYYDGKAIYVRASEAAPPPNAKKVCIAQRWDDKTVQLRFDGAKSEWRNR